MPSSPSGHERFAPEGSGCSALRCGLPATTMASADFCRSIIEPLDSISTRQNGRSLRVRRVTFPPHIRCIYADWFRMTSGFESLCPLAQPRRRLVCSSYSSDRRFACCFLQISSHLEHPCSSAKSSCHQGLYRDFHPTSHFPDHFRSPVIQRQVMTLRAMPDAQTKKARQLIGRLAFQTVIGSGDYPRSESTCCGFWFAIPRTA